MKLINRDKFELTGYNSAVRYTEPKGLVYNCTKNRAKCNLLEYIWFYSEMYFKQKANILWALLYLICPWYSQFKNLHKVNLMEMTVGEFISLVFIIIITLSGLGFVFAILLALHDINEQKKMFLRQRPEEELYKFGERTNFE